MRVSHSRWSRGALVIAVALLLVQSLVAVDQGPVQFTPEDVANVQGSAEPAPAAVATALSSAGGSFVENGGQWDPSVRFHAAGDPLSITLGAGWMAYDLRGEGSVSRVRISFEGSHRVEPVGRDALGHRTNYILGNDPDRWASGVRSFRELVYHSLWDGVDMRLRLSEGSFKYEFVVHPGGDPGDIVMAYGGATGLALDASGGLRIGTVCGDVLDEAPVAMQGGSDVASAFAVDGERVGFRVGEYDRWRKLVIDPGLEFSSFFGGRWNDQAHRNEAVVIGPDGGVYLTGLTGSDDLPVSQGAFCSTINADNYDLFVAKLDHDVSNLLWCTFVGGNDYETVTSIALTDNGTVVIAGMTDSSDFPVSAHAYDATLDGTTDAFVLGLSPDGALLRSGTYLGGNGIDACWDIAIEGTDTVVGVISTESIDFPTTPNVYCSTLTGDYDTVVFRLAMGNQSLEYSSYFGGTGEEVVRSLVLKPDGSVVFGGYTESSDLPTTAGAFDEDYSGGDDDAFIAVMNKEGTSLSFCTYLGGSSYDGLNAVLLDPDGEIWFAGHTDSTDLPVTSNAYQSAFGGGGPIPFAGGDGFFGRLSANGSALAYSSYFGGRTQDWVNDIELGPDGNPVILGTTTSTNLFFPTSAYMPKCNLSGNNGFLAWIDIDDGLLVNGTYFGGDSNNLWANLERDANWTWVFTGTSWGPVFPTTANAFMTSSGGSGDAVIVGLSMNATPRLPPSVPLNLTAMASDGWVNLTWRLPERDGNWPVEGYRVYRGTRPDDLRMYSEVPISTEFRNSGVVNGVTYYYMVTAFNIMGEGPSTPVVPATPFGTPSSPANFTATAVCGTVLLEWDAPLDGGGLVIEGYHLHKGTTLTSMPLLATLDDTDTSFLDADVTNGSTYHYHVRAYHALGNGTPSPIVTVRLLGPPSAPTHVSVSMAGGEVFLTWEPPLLTGGTEVTMYRVYKGTSPDSLTRITSMTAGARTLVDGAVLTGQTYHYAVEAVNAMGPGPLSEVVTITPVGPPGPPRDVGVGSGDGWVNLSWSPPTSNGGSPLLGYMVYRGPEGGPLTQWADVRGATWFNDSGVLNGDTYGYRVSAYTAVGEGPRSSLVSATPFGLPLPPTRVSVVEGTGWLKVTWSPPDDTGGSPLTGYVLYRGTSPDGLEPVWYLGSRETDRIDSGLAVGTTYHYALASVTAVGEGPPGTVVSGKPFGPPGEPTGLEAAGQVGSIRVTWSAPLDDGGRPVTGYVLYRGQASGSIDETLDVGTSTVYVDTDVTVGVTYYYRVVALNEGGEGTRSPEVSASPELPVSPPGPPGHLAAEVVDGRVVLTWSPPLDDGGGEVTGYSLLREASGEAPWEHEVGDVLTYADGSVEAGVEYTYRVSAVNVAGQGEASSPVTVKVEVRGEGEEPLPLWPFLVVLGVVVLLGAAWATEPGRYRLALLLVPLIASKEEVLDNRTRYLLHGIITEKPGIHYTAIKEELELPNGVAVYHLDVLEREEFIRSVRDGRLKRFYSTDTRVTDVPQMTPEETREAIVELIREHPGISQKRVINELGIDRTSAGYFLRELVKEGRLEDGREGRYTVYRLK